MSLLSVFKRKQITPCETPSFSNVASIEIWFNDKIMTSVSVFQQIDEKTFSLCSPTYDIGETMVFRLVLKCLTGRRWSAQASVKEKAHDKIIVAIDEAFKELPEHRRAVKLVARPPLKGYIYNSLSLTAETEDTLVIDENSRIKVSVRDISILGVFLWCTDDLNIFENYVLHLPQLSINVTVKIVRRQEDKSGYGCEFKNLDSEAEAGITRYLNELQFLAKEEMKRLRA